jgi:hypothetical protein
MGTDLNQMINVTILNSIAWFENEDKDDLLCRLRDSFSLSSGRGFAEGRLGCSGLPGNGNGYGQGSGNGHGTGIGYCDD